MGMTLSDREKKARGKYTAQGVFRAGLANGFIIVDHAMNRELILRCVARLVTRWNYRILSGKGLEHAVFSMIYKICLLLFFFAVNMVDGATKFTSSARLSNGFFLDSRAARIV